MENLAETARTYNHIAEDLKLVPSTARNARGQHLLLEVDVRAKKREVLLKTDVRLTLVPPLQAMRKDIIEVTQGLKADLIAEKEALEECLQREAERRDAKQAIDHKIRKLEETYRREKESWEQTEQMLRDEIDTLETRLLKLADLGGEEARVSAALRRLEELKTRKQAKQSEHERTRNEIMEAILDVVTQCANHREYAQKQVRMLKDKFTERLEDGLWGRGVDGVLKGAMTEAMNTIAGVNTKAAAPVPATPVHVPEPAIYSVRNGQTDQRLPVLAATDNASNQLSQMKSVIKPAHTAPTPAVETGSYQGRIILSYTSLHPLLFYHMYTLSCVDSEVGQRIAREGYLYNMLQGLHSTEIGTNVASTAAHTQPQQHGHQYQDNEGTEEVCVTHIYTCTYNNIITMYTRIGRGGHQPASDR